LVALRGKCDAWQGSLNNVLAIRMSRYHEEFAWQRAAISETSTPSSSPSRRISATFNSFAVFNAVVNKDLTRSAELNGEINPQLTPPAASIRV